VIEVRVEIEDEQERREERDHRGEDGPRPENHPVALPEVVQARHGRGHELIEPLFEGRLFFVGVLMLLASHKASFLSG
jgi:hypothetical protein